MDDRRGMNALLGGGRRRPSALQHPMGLNLSRTSLSPYNKSNSARQSDDYGAAPTPSPIPVTPLAYSDVDEEKLPPTSAPTPLAILVHRPSAPAGGVFSYGEESDGEAEEADDVASYARKWPSLSGREEEERKVMEQSQQRTPSLSFASTTPASAPPAVRPSVEGVKDGGEDSEDGESTSEEEESSDEEEAGGQMPTFR